MLRCVMLVRHVASIQSCLACVFFARAWGARVCTCAYSCTLQADIRCPLECRPSRLHTSCPQLSRGCHQTLVSAPRHACVRVRACMRACMHVCVRRACVPAEYRAITASRHDGAFLKTLLRAVRRSPASDMFTTCVRHALGLCWAHLGPRCSSFPRAERRCLVSVMLDAR